MNEQKIFMTLKETPLKYTPSTPLAPAQSRYCQLHPLQMCGQLKRLYYNLEAGTSDRKDRVLTTGI